ASTGPGSCRRHSGRGTIDSGTHSDCLDYGTGQQAMRGMVFSSLCIIPASLCACVAGPDYQLSPDAAVNRTAAKHAFVASQEKVFSQLDLPQFWWRLYDDARLDAYVQEALNANTDLRAADANLSRASFIVQEARAGQTVETGIAASTLASRTGGFTKQA